MVGQQHYANTVGYDYQRLIANKIFSSKVEAAYEAHLVNAILEKVF